jgi:hypothetical protein
MEAKDLRIGNLVFIGKEVNVLDLADFADIYENNTIKHFEPIPLTEEWLLRFGFEKGSFNQLQETHYINKLNIIKVIVSGIGFWDVYTDYSPDISWSNGLNVITNNKGIKHVHQLQNLYFALTDQELILNQ